MECYVRGASTETRGPLVVMLSVVFQRLVPGCGSIVGLRIYEDIGTFCRTATDIFSTRVRSATQPFGNALERKFVDIREEGR